MSKRVLVVGVLVGCSVSLVGACTLITNFDKYTSGRVDKPDVQVPDAPTPDTGPACIPKLVPENTATGVGDGTERFVFAMSEMRVALTSADNADAGADGGDGGGGVNGSARALGYDLDLKCTCPGAGTCITPDIGSSVLKGGACDFENGIDNSIGKVIYALDQLLALGGPATAAQLNPRVVIENGTSSLLFILANYNGTDDDKAVTLVAASASGVDDSTKKRPAEPMLFLPDFDGRDRWSFDGQLVASKFPAVPGEYAFNSPPTGHVVGGILVVPNLSSLTVRVGQLSLKMERTLLTAKLVKTAGSYRLENGVIAGRTSSSAVLKALGGIKWQDGSPLCNGNDAGGKYPLAKDIVCSSQDVTIDGAGNGVEACDALSFAFGFSAVPARLGQAIDLPNPPSFCSSAATDTCIR
jgi:hypothetical protein